MFQESAAPFWVRRITALFTIAVVLVFFFYFFNAVTTVALGVLAAAIVACALNPLLRYIPAPRGLAAGIVGLGLIAVVAGLLLALSLPLARPVQDQLTQTSWNESMVRVDALLVRISNWVHLEKPMSSDELMLELGHFFASDRSWLMLAGVRDAVLAVMLWVAFIFVGSIFLLASSRNVLLAPAIRAIPAAHRQSFHDMLDAAGSRLRWWMIGTLGGMLVVFTASCIGYSIARLKFALPLALLASLCEMVPTVGPALAATVAVFFAASQNGGAVIGVLVTYGVIQTLEAYLVLPLIMRGAVKIHPAISLFSVVFWAKVFGVPGLMLAIPINLTLGSAVEYLYVRPREKREALEAAKTPPALPPGSNVG